MKIFKQGNWDDDSCPLCNTKDEGEVVLVPIDGTQEGYTAQAKQIHAKCISERWWYLPEQKAIICQ